MIVVVLLAGCAGGTNKADAKILDHVSGILKNSTADGGDNSLKELVVEHIRATKDQTSSPEDFEKLADHIENGDIQKASELYEKLGGNPKELEVVPTESDIRDAENDAYFGLMSLYSTKLYIDADFDIEQSDRDLIVEMIQKNMILISDDKSDEFSLLADYIESDNKEEAKKIYESLVADYIPENKLSDFEDMSDYSTSEELREAIDKILK